MIRYLKSSDIQKCPLFIMLPDHYRDDGSCRCNEDTCEFRGCINLKADIGDGREIYCEYHLGWA